MLIIGSVALSQYIHRTPKDIDIIVLKDEYESIPCGNGSIKGVITEITVAEPGSTDEFLATNYSGIAPIDVLYWLKMSHRYKKSLVHFDKTRKDIMDMRSWFERIPDEPTWFRQREKESYTNKLPSLSVSKEDFFGNSGVKFYFDHDFLHTIVSQVVSGSDVPAYTKYLEDSSNLKCDREKFFRLPLETRLQGVTEEAMVLALERSLIPTFYNSGQEGWTAGRIFNYALKKVCTSITGGWFREFAWENYNAIVPPVGYWNHCKELLKLK